MVIGAAGGSSTENYVGYPQPSVYGPGSPWGAGCGVAGRPVNF